MIQVISSSDETYRTIFFISSVTSKPKLSYSFLAIELCPNTDSANPFAPRFLHSA